MQVQPGMVQCRVPYLGHISFHIKGKSCLGHILNTVLCTITKLCMVSFIIAQFIYVIYQQTSITVNTQPKMHVQRHPLSYIA